MKLKDCKKGVEVMVYEYPSSVWIGTIVKKVGSCVHVSQPYEYPLPGEAIGGYYPEQLRKCRTKRKRRSDEA